MMARGSDPGIPQDVQATGWKRSRKGGWGTLHRANYVAYQTSDSRALSLAYVLRNDLENGRVEAQPCRPVWKG